MLPFYKIAIDLTGTLRPTADGHTVCLVVVDLLTKFTIAVPLLDAKASTIAQQLVEKVFCYFGIPAEVLSDNGANLVAPAIQQLCQIYGVRKIQCASYNPQGNSNAELGVKKVKTLLKKQAQDRAKAWV